MKLVILSFKTLSGDRLVGSADGSQVWFWSKEKGLGSVLTKSEFTNMQNRENSTPLTSYSVITLPVCPLCLETSKITGESLLRFCVQSSQAKPLELIMKESKSSRVSCVMQSRVGDSCYARKLVSLCLCLSISSSGLCGPS